MSAEIPEGVTPAGFEFGRLALAIRRQRGDLEHARRRLVLINADPELVEYVDLAREAARHVHACAGRLATLADRRDPSTDPARQEIA